MRKLLLFVIPLLFSWNTTKAQTALDFNGTNYVNCGTAFSTLDNYTIEAKIYFRGVISKRWLLNFSNGTTNERLQIEVNGGQLYSYNQSSGSASGFGGGSIMPNTWYHIAITNDNINGKKLYIDGVLVASNPNTVSPSEMSGTINFNIGKIPGLSNYFDGSVDQFRCWNYVRTASQLLDAKDSCLTGNESGLVALYNFEEGTGTIVNDLTGGNNNGTIINSAAWVAGVNCTSCISDQTVSGDTSFSCSGSTTIDLGSSELGTLYYLRNDADNSIVNSPVAGTEAGISLNTGTINTTTTYNVYATNQTTALDLDGANDYITLGNLNFINSGNTGEYTVEMWVKLDTYNAGYSWVFGDEISSNQGILFEISPTGYITAFHPSVGRKSSTNIQVPLGLWTHIALVQNSSSVSSYVNGKFDDSLLGVGNLNLETASTTFVGIFPGGGRYVDGQIDDLRTWNIARSQSEIKANMLTCMIGTEVGLSNYYNFEDGTGSSILNDLTSNNNNGTLTNMDAATDWVAGSSVCASCKLEMTTKPTVTVNQINNTITQNTGVLTANQGSATYQWYECPNTLLTGETNQSFTPTVIGDFKVEITLSTCTVDSACESVTALGTENFENISKFSIYPNPTSGLLNISTSIDGNFLIVNQLGQIVHSFKATSNIENVINVENLTNGIYFIKGVNGTKVDSQKLIIKK